MTRQEPRATGKMPEIIAAVAYGLFILLLVQILLGALLTRNYRGDPSNAFHDVERMQHGGLALFRGFHYWGSAILILGSLASLVWMVIVKWFNGGHTRIWYATVLLFLTAILFQISGNLLPFDRHGVQTAAIETGVARSMPMVGANLANQILGGPQLGDQTVGRWYGGHIGLTVLALAASVTFWFGIRAVPFNRRIIWAPLAATAAFALLAPAPLGSQATPADYGSFDAQVSWYTWPLHGALNMFSRVNPNLGWIGSLALPGLFLLFLFIAPFLSLKWGPRIVRNGALGFGLVFLGAGIFFGGRFAPLVGNRDPTKGASYVMADPKGADLKLFARGRSLFNSNGCILCHGEDGRHPTVGPNLLGVSQRHGSNPDWYMRFIHEPTSVKPNTMMPDFRNLKPEELRAIAEFLIYQR